MTELNTKSTSVPQARRLESTTSFVTRFSIAATRFRLWLETSESVDAKNFILKFRFGIVEGAHHPDPSVLSCGYSPGAKAPFIYVPPTAGGWVQTPEVQASLPIRWLEITPVRWDGPGPSPAAVFRDVVALSSAPHPRQAQFLTRTSREDA